MSHIAHLPINKHMITLIGGGKVIFFLRMYFRYFIIISPWKRAWPFIRTNLNPIYSMMLCAKFGWNRPIGSGDEDLLVSSVYFLLFRYYLTLENGVAFIWTNLNPELCHVWLKLSGFGEEDENMKNIQTDGQTDDSDQKSSAQMS